MIYKENIDFASTVEVCMIVTIVFVKSSVYKKILNRKILLVFKLQDRTQFRNTIKKTTRQTNKCGMIWKKEIRSQPENFREKDFI